MGSTCRAAPECGTNRVWRYGAVMRENKVIGVAYG